MRMKNIFVIFFCLLILSFGFTAGKKVLQSQDYWMPDYPETSIQFLNKLRGKIIKKRNVSKVSDAIGTLSPVMKEFKDLIDSDSIIRMQLTQMIDQVPGYYKENNHQGYLESIDEMLVLIDEILTTAPEFNETDLVGFPINTVLDWTMGVHAGFAVFRNEKVNSMFKKILDSWGKFLSSSDSLYVLNDSPSGWMCETASKALNMEQFQYDPNDLHWGFTSWNDFFTRKLKAGMRPIEEPNNNKVIVSACDSTVVKMEKNVKLENWFWVKSQPYSLRDMLAKDKNDDAQEHHNNYIEPFIGGVVYQAFLSAKKYHRWHSPVSGKIKKIYIKAGTYYSEAESEGMDPAGPDLSQGYIAHVATRAIIFIEADDPVIGLMCMMPIGMAEVSSCITLDHIVPGYEIKKGEELGYFQYGGSSYCLVFKPGVIKEFRYKNGRSIKIGDDINQGEMIAITN